MNYLYYLRVCFIRLIRDPLSLILTIFTPPFFAIFFWIIYNDNTTDISLAVVNEDLGVQIAQGEVFYGSELISIISDASKNNESLDIQLTPVEFENEARDMMKKNSIDGFISIPSDFSVKCLQQDKTVWRFSMQKGNLFVDAISLLLHRCNVQFNSILTQKKQSVVLEGIGINKQKSISTFNSFVPGLLTFAVIMLVFSVSGAVSREIESGAFIRLRMSSLTPVQLILGLSSVHFCVGIAGVIVTLLTIKLTGFYFEGCFPGILLLCSLSIISATGIGISIASIARSRHKTLLSSCIVMFLFVLFSGIMFPVPDSEIFMLGEKVISLFDLLPTIHLHSGLNAILFRGTECFDLSYECCMSVFLSILFSVTGGWCMRYFVYTDNHRRSR